MKNHVIEFVNEEWIDIPEIAVPNIKPYYKISTFGRIYSSNIDSILNTYIQNSGYLTASITTFDGRKMYLVHRLAMMSFNYIPGCEKLDVNHMDGVKTNNFIWNLEWNTRKENMAHAFRNNLCGFGDNSANKVLDSNTVRDICELLDKGYSQVDIYKQLNLSCIRANVYCIAHGDTWYEISKDYNFLRNDILKTFSIEEISLISKLYLENNKSPEEILYILGYDLNSMRYNKRRIYTNLVSKICYDLDH